MMLMVIFNENIQLKRAKDVMWKGDHHFILLEDPITSQYSSLEPSQDRPVSLEPVLSVIEQQY